MFQNMSLASIVVRILTLLLCKEVKSSVVWIYLQQDPVIFAFGLY